MQTHGKNMKISPSQIKGRKLHFAFIFLAFPLHKKAHYDANMGWSVKTLCTGSLAGWRNSIEVRQCLKAIHSQNFHTQNTTEDNKRETVR